MLVNLCGGPCTGKSTLATRFCTKYPSFKHLSIDSYRLAYREESQAWYQLMIGAAREQNSILETSGLSWHLDAHILPHPTIMGRGILTIVLYGDPQVFHRRLELRQQLREKPAIPFKYKTLTEEGLIIKCHEALPERYPTAHFLQTDNDNGYEEQYKEFEETILKFRETLEYFCTS